MMSMTQGPPTVRWMSVTRQQPAAEAAVRARLEGAMTKTATVRKTDVHDAKHQNDIDSQ